MSRALLALSAVALLVVAASALSGCHRACRSGTVLVRFSLEPGLPADALSGVKRLLIRVGDNEGVWMNVSSAPHAGDTLEVDLGPAYAPKHDVDIVVSAWTSDGNLVGAGKARTALGRECAVTELVLGGDLVLAQGPPSGAQTSLRVEEPADGWFDADGEDVATAHALVKDANGLAVTGRRVTLVVTGPRMILDAGEPWTDLGADQWARSLLTDEEGKASWSFRTLAAGKKDLSLNPSAEGRLTAATVSFRLALPEVTGLTVARGASPGCVVLGYVLKQPASEPVAAKVEFFDGAGYRPIRLGLGQSLAAQASSPAGEPHHFVWNSHLDVAGYGTVHLRITPVIADGREGLGAQWDAIPLNHKPAFAHERTGAEPIAIGLEDLDGDGILDAVTLDEAAKTLTVLLGLGDGSFRADRSYLVGDSPSAFAMADLNGDGLPDLVGTNARDVSVRVLMALGAGAYAPQVRYNVGAVGQDPIAVLLVDVDGDGDEDLVTTNRGAGGTVHKITTLFNNGAGIFVGMKQGDATLSLVGLVAGDFDGDGVVDLAGTDSAAKKVSVWLGDGTGRFVDAPSGLGNNLIGTVPTAVASAHFDEDTHLDLAITTLSGGNYTIEILKGQGDGSFQSTGTSIFSGLAVLSSVRAADLTGDGVPDLITASAAANEVKIYAGQKNGNFTLIRTITGGNQPWDMAVSDVNGDGSPDLVVAYHGDDRIVPYLADGTEGWLARTSTYDVPARPVALKSGDFTGDGRDDLVLVSRPSPAPSEYPDRCMGQVAMLRSQSGFVPFELSATQTVGGCPVDAATTDFNGDGQLDLLILDEATDGIPMDPTPPPRALVSLQGHGGEDPWGDFEQMATIAFTRTPVGMAIADLIGGSAGDVVLSLAGDRLEVLEGREMPNLGAFTPTWMTTLGGGPTRLVVADFDGDAVMDAAALLGSADSVAILRGQGDGSFALVEMHVVGIAPSALVVMDADRDGIVDLVIANRESNDLVVLSGIGDGTFAFQRSVAAGGSRPSAIVTADFNGDGFGDLAVALSDDDRVSILLSGAAGHWQLPVLFEVGDLPEFLAVGDFNGDGAPDLATANAGSNDVTVLMNHLPLACYP